MLRFMDAPFSGPLLAATRLEVDWGDLRSRRARSLFCDGGRQVALD